MDKKHEAILNEKKDLGKDIFEYSFGFDNSTFSFIPGQYIWLELPDGIESDPHGMRRAFSIASSVNDQNSIKLLIQSSQSGYHKTLKNLEPGGNVTIHGPFGSSFILPNMGKKIVLIAQGVAIAPFFSILRSMDTLTPQPALEVKYFVGQDGMPVIGEELSSISTRNHIPFYSISDPPNEINLPYELDEDRLFYISGNQTFVNAVNTILSQQSYTKSHFHFEHYYPSTPSSLTESDFSADDMQKNIMLTAVQDSKSHIIVTDKNGMIVFANETAQKNTGFSFAEMRGNTPRLWGGLMSPEFYQELWHSKYGTKGFDGEIINRKKNGEVYHVISHISAIHNDQQEVIGFIGTEEDITQRVQLEEELKTQNNIIAREKEKDSAILESIGDGVVAVDRNGSVVSVNAMALKLLEYTSSEVIGKKYVDLVTALDEAGKPIAEEQRGVTKAIHFNTHTNEILTYITHNRTKIIVNVINTPLVLDEMTFGCVIVFRDITKEREIDKAKTEFISLASHQLRTPLTTINWYLEMVLAGDVGKVNDDQKKYIQEAYRGSKRLVDLVKALLNVSRIEAGTFMIEPQQTNIGKLIQTVIAESKSAIENKHLRMEFTPNDIPPILLDPNLMTIVIQNLITNAIRYSFDNGAIIIKTSLHHKGEEIHTQALSEDVILIELTDHGIGIPAEQQKHIYEKLYRADNARKHETDGTGLGLYLIKALIERSNGDIWFTSIEGQGTSFFVTLPLTGMHPKSGDKKIDI